MFLMMNDTIADISSTEIRKDFLGSKNFMPEKIFNVLKTEGTYIAKL